MSYRLTVSCEFDGSDTSDAIEVSINNNPEDCYCIPTYSTGCISGDRISNVSLTGETTSLDNDSGCSDDAYGDYTDLTPSDLAPGETYTLDVSTDYSFPASEQVKAWIDYNQDGQFSDEEEIADTEGEGLPGGTGVFEFTVPEDTNPGDYRMRVRLVYSGSATDFDACENKVHGEAEDYIVEVIQLDACQGTPTAGTMDEDDFSVCVADAFSISVSDASDPEGGLSRIWQSSPEGEDDWTDIDGATSSTYYSTDGIEEPTDFRYKVTCANSDETDVSDIITISLNPATDCYCIPTYIIGCNNDKITNVTLTGETESINNDSECSDNDYGDYTDLTPADLIPGNTYTLSVSTDYIAPTSEQVRAWIDYNQNGQFSDDEEIANTNGDGLPGGTGTFEFTVPEDASSGDYRMRVRMSYSFMDSNFDACEEENNGEAEDYAIELIELSECEGTPTAGTIDNDDFSVCGGDAFSLSVSGASDPAESLERNWQSSPEGQDDWSNIDGATSNTYSSTDGIGEATDFRYKVTCGNNDETDVSDVITVTLKPANECYCVPEYSIGCASGDRISNVSLAGETESLNNDSECSDGSYGDYTDLTPADLMPGDVYTLSVFTDYSLPTSEQVRAWIDYNQDGQFSDDEEIANTDGDGLVGGTQTFEFTVPEDADAGNYRMRVRLMYSADNSSFDACESLSHGEAEDYIVELLDPPTCFRPLELMVSNVTDTSAQISWEPDSGETEWEVVYGEAGFNTSEDGTVVTVEGDPETILEDLEQDTNYEVYVRVICSEDEQSTLTGPVSFTTLITPPENNYLCDAIALTANDDCANGPYTDVGAFEEVDEPSGSCLTNFHGTNTVWFSFVGPSNGEVMITTDFPETEFNTEIVVFEAPTDCDDLSTLGEEVGCASSTATVELTDLTPGNIYYVKVAGFNNEEGEFCIEVQTDGETPTPCPAPSDIFVEVGEMAVDVSWTSGGNENQWTVIYGEAGFNPDDQGETVMVTGIPETTLTDLEPETDYEVYVMANCEDDNTSDMAGPESFTSGDMSVEDYLFEDFAYYPNPVKDQLTLKAGTQIESVTVYNLLGQTVLTENPNQLETQLSTESLQAGVYLMKVTLNGSEKSFRVIKR